MTSWHISIAVIYISLTFAAPDEKWIWSKEQKNGLVQTETASISIAKPVLTSKKIGHFDDTYRYNRNEKSARYEVEEAFNHGSNRPIPPRPYTGPFLPDTATPERYPGSTFPSQPALLSGRRPDKFSSPLPFQVDTRVPLGPGQTPAILTGPVPSWERPNLNKNGDPTNFDHCKCSFSFNCKSPGIQFGSCDEGKTYCCHNELNNVRDNLDRYDGSVLVGPGGPGRPFTEQRESLGSYNPSYGRPYIQKPILPPYAGFHNDYRSSK